MQIIYLGKVRIFEIYISLLQLICQQFVCYRENAFYVVSNCSILTWVLSEPDSWVSLVSLGFKLLKSHLWVSLGCKLLESHLLVSLGCKLLESHLIFSNPYVFSTIIVTVHLWFKLWITLDQIVYVLKTKGLKTIRWQTTGIR